MFLLTHFDLMSMTTKLIYSFNSFVFRLFITVMATVVRHKGAIGVRPKA